MFIYLHSVNKNFLYFHYFLLYPLGHLCRATLFPGDVSRSSVSGVPIFYSLDWREEGGFCIVYSFMSQSNLWGLFDLSTYCFFLV